MRRTCDSNDKTVDQKALSAVELASPSSEDISVFHVFYNESTRDTTSHFEQRGLLIYVQRGMLQIQYDGGTCLLAPMHALWLPACTRYSLSILSPVETYLVSVDCKITSYALQQPCNFFISPLFKELIIAAAHFPSFHRLNSHQARLLLLLLDELHAAPKALLNISVPNDIRLKKVYSNILLEPGNKSTLQDFASQVAMSERSLGRLINREIGISFVKWRQQLNLVIALQRLCKGDAIQSIAFDLGYESSSGFISMFKKHFGHSPKKFSSNINFLSPTQGVTSSNLPTQLFTYK